MNPERLTILALTTYMLAVSVTTAAAQDKPNVVLMLADNMGYGDLGA